MSFLLLYYSILSLTCYGETAAFGSSEYLQTVWTTEDGLPQNSVNAILQSREGYLWLATFGGLARFDGVRFTTFNSGNTPGLLSNRILSLCEDRSGTIWLTTQSGEVMSFKDGVGRTFTTADGLPGGGILGIRETGDGSIWMATVDGMARLRGDKFTVYTTLKSRRLPD